MVASRPNTWLVPAGRVVLRDVRPYSASMRSANGRPGEPRAVYAANACQPALSCSEYSPVGNSVPAPSAKRANWPWAGPAAHRPTHTATNCFCIWLLRERDSGSFGVMGQAEVKPWCLSGTSSQRLTSCPHPVDGEGAIQQAQRAQRLAPRRRPVEQLNLTLPALRRRVQRDAASQELLDRPREL